jgi:RHS repeat-associated protein
MTATYQYDVFGAVKAQTGTADTGWRFTGELQDPTVGRSPYYLRARYYDPAIGRFTSRDPWPANAMNPQSLNRYPYVLNNPATLVDPYGLFCVGPLCTSDVTDKARGLANKAIDYVTDPQQIGTALQVGGLFIASKACPAGFTPVTGGLCAAGIAAYGAGTFVKWRDTSQHVHSGRCSPSQGKAADILAVLPLPGNPVKRWVEGKVIAPILDKLYSGYAEGAEACESPAGGSSGPKE